MHPSQEQPPSNDWCMRYAKVWCPYLNLGHLRGVMQLQSSPGDQLVPRLSVHCNSVSPSAQSCFPHSFINGVLENPPQLITCKHTSSQRHLEVTWVHSTHKIFVSSLSFHKHQAKHAIKNISCVFSY